MKAQLPENLDTLSREKRSELVRIGYAYATKYGEGAAAASCEMYDAIAKESGVDVPDAEPAETATYPEAGKAVNGTLKTGNAEIVAGSVGRMVKMAGVDTMMKNAIRDGAEWAWIPQGNETCAFCIMLASRGWQRASKAALNGDHADHIHAHCDCMYAIRFDSETNVEGYDPEKYKAMYDEAEGDTWEEKLNSMRREISKHDDRKLVGSYNKTGRLSSEEYARAVDIWDKVSELRLPEREHVIEEFDNWLTSEEKSHCIVSREVDNYRYYAVTKGHNEYKIYKKEPVTKNIDWLDDVLTEVIGPDWRKYDL